MYNTCACFNINCTLTLILIMSKIIYAHIRPEIYIDRALSVFPSKLSHVGSTILKCTWYKHIFYPHDVYKRYNSKNEIAHQTYHILRTANIVRSSRNSCKLLLLRLLLLLGVTASDNKWSKSYDTESEISCSLHYIEDQCNLQSFEKLM